MSQPCPSRHRPVLAGSFALAIFLAAQPVRADPMAYVVTLSQQFGTVNLATGAFASLGPGLPEGAGGLVAGAAGSLLTLSFTGNLDAIDVATGNTTLVGATGLGDNANALARLGSTLYATDLANNIYTLDAVTGHATLIGPTGIPALAAYPGTINADGSLNLFDESLFSKDGNLYATFDSFALASDGFTTNFDIESKLYRIDPATGIATFISSATPNVLALVEIDHTAYSFLGSFSADDPYNGHVRSSSFDLTNGQTQFLASVDSSVILGASAVQAVPEPATDALLGVGLVCIALNLRRRQLRARGMSPTALARGASRLMGSVAVAFALVLPAWAEGPEGSWRLVERKWSDGRVETPPRVIGLVTFAHGLRQVSLFWHTPEGQRASLSIVSRFEQVGSTYSETPLASALDLGGGAPVAYGTGGETRTVAVSRRQRGMTYKMPFEGLDVTYEGDRFTATREGEFVDYWKKSAP